MSSIAPSFPFVSLDHIAIGRPITRCGVSLFPIYTHVVPRDYRTGPGSGVLISEQASAEVPTLVAHNPTNQPVLLVAGETVIGGRQNRVLNVSVVLPANSEVLVPVSCVEQGRWNEGSFFESGRSFAPRRVRRAKVATVGENVRVSGVKFADQGLVWDMVGSELNRVHAVSASGALNAVEAHLDGDRALAEALAELQQYWPLQGQCGVIVAHGSRIVSVELFAAPAMLRAHWGALIRGILADAPQGVVGRPSASQALRFMHRLATSTPVVTDGVGLGQEHHVRTPRMVAQVLVVDEAIVHASAFALAA
jgi:hypothetical protein